MRNLNLFRCLLTCERISEELLEAISKYVKETAEEIFEERYRKWKQRKIEDWSNLLSVYSELDKKVREEFKGLIHLGSVNLGYERLKDLGLNLSEIRTEKIKELILGLEGKESLSFEEILEKIGVTEYEFYRSGLRISDLREFSCYRLDPLSNHIIELLKDRAYNLSELLNLLEKENFETGKIQVRDRLDHLVKKGVVHSTRINIPGNRFNLYSRDPNVLEERASEYDKLKVHGQMLTPRQLAIYRKIENIGEVTKRDLKRELKDREEFQDHNLNGLLKYNLRVLMDKGLIRREKIKKPDHKFGSPYLYVYFVSLPKQAFEILDNIVRYHPNEVRGEAFQREDLDDLENMGFLTSRYVLKKKFYRATEKGMLLHRYLKDLSGSPILNSFTEESLREGLDLSQISERAEKTKDWTKKRLDEFVRFGIFERVGETYRASNRYQEILTSYLQRSKGEGPYQKIGIVA